MLRLISWCSQLDSNQRPLPYQGSALPPELCEPALERVAGIEPASSAWKAEVLPLNYTRSTPQLPIKRYHLPTVSLVGGGGRIRTYEGEPSDLQSDPFDHSGTPPHTKQRNQHLKPKT